MILYSYSRALLIVLTELLVNLKWWVFTTLSDLEPEGMCLWVEHRDLLPSPLIPQAGHNLEQMVNVSLAVWHAACKQQGSCFGWVQLSISKGFWTRAAIHVGSWCYCLPLLLTIAASFVAQRLLYYDGFVTKSLLKHLSLMKASRIKQIIALPEKFT